MTEVLTGQISRSLSINKQQVSATVELLEQGATIPFISRYRKEATGSLDEMLYNMKKFYDRMIQYVPLP